MRKVIIRIFYFEEMLLSYSPEQKMSELFQYIMNELQAI